MANARIMVVDDEAFVVEELAEALSEEGYKVTTVTNAIEALAMPELVEIDVVLTDLKMPGMTGIDLFAAMRERGMTAQGILLSGHGAQAERNAAHAVGFFACLSKPVDIDDLLDAVSSACSLTEQKEP